MQGVSLLATDFVPDLAEQMASGLPLASMMVQLNSLTDTDEC